MKATAWTKPRCTSNHAESNIRLWDSTVVDPNAVAVVLVDVIGRIGIVDVSWWTWLACLSYPFLDLPVWPTAQADQWCRAITAV